MTITYGILYLTKDQFHSIHTDTLLTLQALSFDKSVHIMEGMYAIGFRDGNEVTAKEVLTDFYPNLEVPFETISTSV